MKNDSIHINCPILLYSNFSDNIAIAKEETVHLDKFRRDIETLISEGYTIVSLVDILDAKKSKSFLPERSVCIALFGGYEGQYRGLKISRSLDHLYNRQHLCPPRYEQQGTYRKRNVKCPRRYERHKDTPMKGAFVN